MKNAILKVDHTQETFEVLSAEQVLDEIIFNGLDLDPVICSSIFEGFLKFETDEGDITYEIYRGNYAYQFEEVEKRLSTLEDCGYFEVKY